MSLLTSDTALIEALDKASSTCPVEESPFINALLGYAWTKTEEGAALLRVVEDADQLQIFDETLQSLGNGGAAVCRTSLANWMIRRARTVGAAQAVGDVEHYIQHDSFDAYQIMLLSNPFVEDEGDLGGDIRLVPIQRIPSERLLRNIGMDQLYNMLPTPRASGALIRQFRHKREHIQQAEDSSFQHKSEGFEALEDARLCITLARKTGCAVQAIGSTTVAADDVPILNGSSWQIHPERSHTLQASLIAMEVKASRSWHEDFLKLDPKGQAHLRIPMRKLNQCAADVDAVEAAIDLRVALESLLLSDDEAGEISYRLALRAAIAAGGSLEDQKKIRKDMKKVYGWCSKAVHTGRLPPSSRRDLLNWARGLVRDVLCQMIRDGISMPDWNDVELASHLTTIDQP